MVFNPELYRLEELVNTPGADQDEIKRLREKLIGKSNDKPKQNRYNSTPVRFTFPNGEVEEYGTQREAVEASGVYKMALERSSRLGIPLKKGAYAGATVEILSQQSEEIAERVIN